MYFTVTANDAENIVSTVTLSSVGTPTASVTSGSISGSGSLSAGFDTTNKLSYTSGDQWKATVTMNYTLGGQAKTLTATLTKQPMFGYASFLYYTKSSGTADSKNVTMNVEIWINKEDPMSYNVDFKSIKLVWMTEGDSYTYSETGEEKVVWDGSGASPITASGPEDTGSEYLYTWTYEGVLDVRPHGNSNATHFMLVPDCTAYAKDPYDGSTYPLPDAYHYDPNPVN